MDIDALRSLIAIADTGSFTRAGQQIFRTQSAVSAQMKKLEQETDSQLFEKDGRQLRLSPAGLALLGYARRIVNLHDEARDELAEQAVWPRVVIGCPEDYSLSILPSLLACLSDLQPELSYQLIAGPTVKLRKMLDDNQLDMAVLTRSPSSDEGYLLRHDQGVWVGDQRSQALQTKPLSLALYEADCKFHSAALDGLSKQETPFRLLATSSHYSCLYGLVEQGLAISAMARSSIGQLKELSSVGLPQLPAIDIVVAGSRAQHPALNEKRLQALAEAFREVDGVAEAS